MSQCKHEPDWDSAILVGPSLGCTPPVVDVPCIHCGAVTGVGLQAPEWDESCVPHD